MVVAVMIIGILSSIAIPRLSRGGYDANAAAMRQNLAILSSAMELYSVEHAGRYPAARGDGVFPAHTEGAFLAQLTQYSDVGGATAAARSSAKRFGPYLLNGVPPLTVGDKAGSDEVKVVTGATPVAYDGASPAGWVYSDVSGEIIPNIPNGQDNAVIQQDAISADWANGKGVGKLVSQ
ncbi:MAG: hypothetical protein CHACPFDD_00020 [Phycisphaerae bacterium]|nr:hypothetical protein [Phycisphaerae bacterium]